MKFIVLIFTLIVVIVSCSFDNKSIDDAVNRVVINKINPFGSKKLEKLNDFFLAPKPGSVKEIDMLFPKGKKSTVLIEDFNVKSGYILFKSEAGYLKFTANKTVESKPKKDLDIKTFSFPHSKQTLFIVCSTGYLPNSTKPVTSASLNINVKDGIANYITQELSFGNDHKYWIVRLSVEFSEDFKGEIQNWRIPYVE